MNIIHIHTHTYIYTYMYTYTSGSKAERVKERTKAKPEKKSADGPNAYGCDDPSCEGKGLACPTLLSSYPKLQIHGLGWR